MKNVIIDRRKFGVVIPNGLSSLLPIRIVEAINRCNVEENTFCEEIRLRVKGLSLLLMSGGKSIPLRISITRDDMDEIVDRLCGGSLYAHADTIKNGYISVSGGIRVGVCGSAAMDNGRIIGVNEISSLCIRIPHTVKVDTDPIIALLKRFSYTKGVLIYSPPGEGKTTLLRSVARDLSRIGQDGVLNVAVVDTRGELCVELDSGELAADVLKGYPKNVGVEIAMRTLNVDVIICDEIGNESEARAMLDASNGGVALIASAHASAVDELLSKKSISLLHENGVFGAYVGIKRNGNEYKYTVNMVDEV